METTNKKVVVTGGSGALGQAVVAALSLAGFNVLSLDRRAHPGGHKPAWIADLLNIGTLYEACVGAHAVVHLAAHIAPGLASDTDTFNDNVRMTYNVMKAATDSGAKKIVHASSTAVYGFLYGRRGETPDYLPADEKHSTNPTDPYGLSKVMGERLADAFVQGKDIAITSLRFPGINYDPAFARIKSLLGDPAFRAPGFWSYVDVRDAAEAVRLSLSKDFAGHRRYNIACDASNMSESTKELVAKYFPDLRDVRMKIAGNWSGIDCRAAAEELGFTPAFRWDAESAKVI